MEIVEWNEADDRGTHPACVSQHHLNSWRYYILLTRPKSERFEMLEMSINLVVLELDKRNTRDRPAEKAHTQQIFRWFGEIHQRDTAKVFSVILSFFWTSRDVCLYLFGWVWGENYCYHIHYNEKRNLFKYKAKIYDENPDGSIHFFAVSNDIGHIRTFIGRLFWPNFFPLAF